MGSTGATLANGSGAGFGLMLGLAMAWESLMCLSRASVRV